MTHIRKSLFFASALFLLFTFNSCYDKAWDNYLSGNEKSDKDLAEIVKSNNEISIFNELLQRTGYDEVLKLSDNFTVFAPTNAAWSGIDTTGVDKMRKIIGTLIVYKSYYSENQENFNSFKCVNGKVIYYNSTTQTINGAKIITPDLFAANGVLHITDKVVERKENIWDYILQKSGYNQINFIDSLTTRVMDMEKSIAIGVENGSTKYDTVWTTKNDFLEKYPINNEDSVYTYVVIQNEGFATLYNKYKPFFKQKTDAATDLLTRMNVCQDFVFKGIVDIQSNDTLTNIDGIKVPFKNAVIIDTYNASNGKVYVISASNIRLKDKIKPIKIEGESFNSAYNKDYVFTRYRLWASGERDIVLAGGETQSDSLWRKVPLPPSTVVTKDSVADKNYFINSSYVANVNHFHIEYKVNVNSANYDMYYVAYNDIPSHNDAYGVYKVKQKIFISMPGFSTLKNGITDNARGIANNYLGETRCFVGEGKAGVHELTKLKQWNLFSPTQLLDTPYNGPNNDLVSVTRSGTMTIWLTNTATRTAANRQGLLFLDYILLVPRINE